MNPALACQANSLPSAYAGLLACSLGSELAKLCSCYDVAPHPCNPTWWLCVLAVELPPLCLRRWAIAAYAAALLRAPRVRCRLGVTAAVCSSLLLIDRTPAKAARWSGCTFHAWL